jgi:CheY-like chemotaxis protein
MMPDISGDKLAKLLRSNPKLQHLTIVLVSSGKLEDLSQLAADVSADSVASKAEIHQRLAEVALTAHQRRVSLRPRKRTEQ